MVDQARIEIGLNAAIVSIVENAPNILQVSDTADPEKNALPYGQFDPLEHRTRQEGLRELAEEQTGLRPGYIEQLYTFGDRGRAPADDESPHVVSVGYLALTRINPNLPLYNANWRNWYEYFPWEDWRKGRPTLLDEVVIPALRSWSVNVAKRLAPVRGIDPASRIRLAFGLDGGRWDDELVLDRYEIMYSAGLVDEAMFDGRIDVRSVEAPMGHPMLHDHRRILATAIARLRSKIKYRPVIFELMPDTFTLFELQKTVESILGRSVHKQNFRRLVENADLVENTGESKSATGGRPAALFRFRSEILRERPAAGLKAG